MSYSAFFRQTRKLDVAIGVSLWKLIALPFKLLFKLFNIRISFKSKSLEEIYKIRKTNPSKAGYMFEDLIKDSFNKIGFKAEKAMKHKNDGKYPKELMKTKGDGGLDVIAESNDEIILIQTKLYSSRIKKEVVSTTRDVRDMFFDYYRAKGDKRKISCYIITNNEFDNTAIAFAPQCNINLMDGKKLMNFLKNIEKNS